MNDKRQDAELNYTRTQGQVFTAMIDMYKATGGGWVAEAARLTATDVPPSASSGKPRQ
ncbi:hypothetical protein [Pseudomonas fluorescens]|uniref:Uncharacterized protein n=1 Tax=Pseudomonas fluorescens TaxID=294 RepID=A0A5E7C9R4_PSEFL|nr:hypothetical protein [Pseudomonas fluorescens]VVN92683.1 hypothetical protein PS691_01995 [Pseudomonas fluorescens]